MSDKKQDGVLCKKQSREGPERKNTEGKEMYGGGEFTQWKGICVGKERVFCGGGCMGEREGIPWKWGTQGETDLSTVLVVADVPLKHV